MLRVPVVLAPLAAIALLAAPLSAQSAPAPAPSTPPPGPALDFSGQLWGSYSFQPSATDRQQANQQDNAFTLDRAYLTFRMPVGERTSVRITTDVYQATDSARNAYSVRAKYAYLQYDGARHASGVSVTGRVGILQGVLYEHEETFWPRLLAQPAVEKAGYFPSADAGIATLVSFPDRAGELYATITNGPGYTARERDRFKDFAIRLSLTPLAGQADIAPLLQSLTLTAWGYKGAVASSFVNGGAGQVGAVGDAIDRSRAGLFAGVKDPRLVLAGEFAQRHDGQEQGLNTTASPRTLGATTGNLLSAFTVVRPFAFTNGTGKSPLAVVARYDRVTPTAASDNLTPAAIPGNAYHVLIAGLLYDLPPHMQLALDYQESLASDNGVSGAPPSGPAKGYFAQLGVTF